jgi:hypothetical protein
MNEPSYTKHWLKAHFSLSAWIPSFGDVKVPFTYLEQAVSHVPLENSLGSRQMDCAARWNAMADIFEQAPGANDSGCIRMIKDDLRQIVGSICSLRDHGMAALPEAAVRGVQNSESAFLYAISAYNKDYNRVHASQNMLRQNFGGDGNSEAVKSAQKLEDTMDKIRVFYNRLQPLICEVQLPEQYNEERDYPDYGDHQAYRSVKSFIQGPSRDYKGW